MIGPDGNRSEHGGESVASAWEHLAAVAASWDERRGGASTKSWVPPILGALVQAARSSSLGCFYPFTSHARLCFSTGPAHWLAEGEVLPICIALHPESRYVVAYKHAPTEIVLETTSAEEAVMVAVRVIEGRLQL
ncbi:DUF6193 family natural product biosynthesis protein [Kitasatospora sp. NPDC047058]|uniref:DUF6193 family natural product biosynthesis protein n=1 Tax=Kitasatospora sp. NPDC047058 TaxID=3155620 RepID=UPI0033CC41B8